MISIALAVQKRYTADAADPLAAAIGFFGFLSLFPLILLAVSVAGFVLDDPEEQVAVAEVITESIPGFDAALGVEGDQTAVADLVGGAVEQRGTLGIVGLVLVLMSGLRVVAAAMTASRVVFRGELLGGLKSRVRQLLALVGLGGTALLAAGASSFAGVGTEWLPVPLAVAVSFAVTFALDFGLFLGAYTLLAPTADLSVRERVPGALLGGAGWTVLKIVGATYVAGQVENANALYGALGGVIGLLLLLYLAGRLYLYGAELSAVLAERRRGALDASAASTPADGDPADGGPADGGPADGGPVTADGVDARVAPVSGTRTRSSVAMRRDPRVRFLLGAALGAAAVAWRAGGERT